MDDKQLFARDDIINTYKKIHDLLITQHIIKKYSTNKEDIRTVALKGIDLSNKQNVLELGSGYGFFIENLKGLLHPGAVIKGIDLVENNKETYLSTVSSIGYTGEFISGDVSIIKQYADSSFDFIISSYSLYFFPELLQEIARILHPDGLFLIVTHSRFSLQEVLKFLPECLDSTGLGQEGNTSIKKLFSAFSSENGSSQIIRYFNEYNYIPYKNIMIFPFDEINDCVYYLQKKKYLLYKDVIHIHSDKIEELDTCLAAKVFEAAREHGHFALTKIDAVFQCYKPKK